MRLRLSDEGEGWPADAPHSLFGHSTGEAAAAGELSLKIEFESPLELQQPSPDTPSGLGVFSYCGAWVQPRLVGDRIGTDRAVSVYVWLVPQGSLWGEPPERLPDLWASCALA